MTLGPGDIDRWDAEQVRAVSRAARSRAESALITVVVCACVLGVSTRRLEEISAQHQARGSRESNLVHHFRGHDLVCVQR